MTIRVLQIPWYLWLPFAIAFVIAAHLIARKLLGRAHEHRTWMTFGLGVLTGMCLVTMAAAPAVRSWWAGS